MTRNIIFNNLFLVYSMFISFNLQTIIILIFLIFSSGQVSPPRTHQFPSKMFFLAYQWTVIIQGYGLSITTDYFSLFLPANSLPPIRSPFQVFSILFPQYLSNAVLTSPYPHHTVQSHHKFSSGMLPTALSLVSASIYNFLPVHSWLALKQKHHGEKAWGAKMNSSWPGSRDSNSAREEGVRTRHRPKDHASTIRSNCATSIPLGRC